MSFDAIQSVRTATEITPDNSPKLSLDGHGPSSDDVNWFSAQLKVTPSQPDANVAERIVGQLSGSSQHLQQLSDNADRALRKAADSSNPQDVIQANRALSSFYLESLLTTKLISKGTQAIEKLTNLQ